LSHKDELLTALTQGLDQFVFQNMPYHVNNDAVDNIESLLELNIINRSKKLELPKNHTMLLPSHI